MPASSAPATRAALARLADAGIPLMGQTVLLAGVNDDVETLDQLMRALVMARVKPYYLHHPDLVRGTGHFRVSVERGQALMKALRGRLSGLAQPTYVLDVPGGHGKVPIGPAYLGDDPDALADRGRLRRTAPLSALTLLDQDFRCRSAPAPRPRARRRCCRPSRRSA